MKRRSFAKLMLGGLAGLIVAPFQKARAKLAPCLCVPPSDWKTVKVKYTWVRDLPDGAFEEVPGEYECIRRDTWVVLPSAPIRKLSSVRL